MQTPRLVKVSKYLSKHLRHQPDRLHLTLAPGGWVSVDELLAACAAHQFPISRSELEAVVKTSDKQRFSFDETGTRIRANQGHSVEVDLQLEPQTPPEVLYHGTGEKSVESILRSGLRKLPRDRYGKKGRQSAWSPCDFCHRCGCHAPGGFPIFLFYQWRLVSGSGSARIFDPN
jgi:RNA:NAD 2'-phosphotransferase (TPT1/KptA family)